MRNYFKTIFKEKAKNYFAYFCITFSSWIVVAAFNWSDTQEVLNSEDYLHVIFARFVFLPLLASGIFVVLFKLFDRRIKLSNWLQIVAAALVIAGFIAFFFVSYKVSYSLIVLVLSVSVSFLYKKKCDSKA